MTNSVTNSAAGAAVSSERADELPILEVPIAPEQVPERLETAARRGLVPGLEPITQSGRFVITDFGTPFESRLFGEISPSGTGSMVRFRTEMKTKGFWIFAIVLVLTVWPGVWLTDSMLVTYFPSYSFATWKWYLPLTVPFVPISLRSAVQKSRKTASIEARNLIGKLETALGGKVRGG